MSTPIHPEPHPPAGGARTEPPRADGGEAADAGPPLLALRAVCKRFGAVQALTDVDLELRPGRVTALVGDNGAGKSTLVKTIAGVNAADAGTIEWRGEPVRITRPHDAQELGIATVYQDLALCDNLDVVANLYLGRELGRMRTLDEVTMEARARELLDSLAIRIPSVRIPVASLSGGQRQVVAIARALIGEPEVVVLDEPTAALGVEQTAQVLDLVERLRERGLAVVLVSHNMADVQAVADDVAVLRLGRNNGLFEVAATSHEEIVAAITGAADNAVTRRRDRTAASDSPAASAHAGPRPPEDDPSRVARPPGPRSERPFAGRQETAPARAEDTPRPRTEGEEQ